MQVLVFFVSVLGRMDIEEDSWVHIVGKVALGNEWCPRRELLKTRGQCGVLS